MSDDHEEVSVSERFEIPRRGISEKSRISLGLALAGLMVLIPIAVGWGSLKARADTGEAQHAEMLERVQKVEADDRETQGRLSSLEAYFKSQSEQLNRIERAVIRPPGQK